MFKLEYSEKVKAQLKQLYQQTADMGHGELFPRIVAKIDKRLRDEPLSFGEALYSHPHARVQIRHGVEHFVVVCWAVHEETQIVLLKDYKLLPNVRS